jgi:hypothetical protein
MADDKPSALTRLTDDKPTPRQEGQRWAVRGLIVGVVVGLFVGLFEPEKVAFMAGLAAYIAFGSSGLLWSDLKRGWFWGWLVAVGAVQGLAIYWASVGPEVMFAGKPLLPWAFTDIAISIALGVLFMWLGRKPAPNT